MAVHPIEYRYGHKEMKDVWSEKRRLQKLLSVEVALAKALALAGYIPEGMDERIAPGADKVTLDRVKEIEDEIHHDVMAVVLALAEQSGDAGKWVHFGATSNDILDTATALQIKDAILILRKDVVELRSVLLDMALSHKNTVCAGRTHGQIGIPTTYGLRFAIWASEVDRHIERLDQLMPRATVGKMSGAVGTQAAFGKKGIEIQKRTMEILGIESADVSNQIIQRDRHAEFVMWMANTVTTLDKICIEIRTLARSEIAEVEESFGKKQVGSSTMPHKRNPIKSEQVCGLARIIRAMLEPALLNNTLWDERDLTNSSCERVVFPESCVLTDHVIRLTTGIIRNLRLYPDNIRKNLNMLNGMNMGEAIMIELSKKGVGRQEAHEIVRQCAMSARESRGHMKDALLMNRTVSEYMSESEIINLMNPDNYIGTAVEQVESLVTKLKNKN
ncbi:adenylosuccinate lyase [Candidatus Methanoperedens nitroreducens]|uniref:Adenylosuccinate lyase n=1 Tax=Candidatus Methanoperedens nitratireducens TaxID=1392998 RepID=A0A062V905_9EURY|nr:adenylosuccinate lyase [Candidatus Methanoperedens nitroreducens]KCZ73003.1 adenylosuccinate lyase [Candidatus Methanoperedens nitroreducens]MDJ1423053.1 adenylosuccinate lyase [Candidatus Methanoperedens sp.]